jgi:N6-L-threonylcarbamoyladenine synthase
VRSFTVLAVESSADDTCAAVVGSDRRIYSNIVLKQNEVYVILNRNLVLNLNTGTFQT